MTCLDRMPPALAESEREEGEIVDELDELSDISSEEEYLMRQRLQVLESYNHVLERKEAKRSSSVRPGKRKENDTSLKNLDGVILSSRVYKDTKPIHHKRKRKKESLVRKSSLEQPLSRHKEHRKKPHKLKKKIVESSDESDYEYRNKRRKLANAVSVKQGKTDTSLKARLMKMLCQTQNIGNPMTVDSIEKEMKLVPEDQEWSLCSYADLPDEKDKTVVVDENNKELAKDLSTNKLDIKHEPDKEKSPEKKTSIIEEAEIIDSSSDGLEFVTENNDPISIDASKIEEVSDEDLESLRQHALKSKSSKSQDQISKIVSEDNCALPDKSHTENKSKPVVSEDEDSDTAELRLICLKSALLKKAIEMKQKQKLRKRLSQSTSLHEDITSNDFENSGNCDVDNNTDIESVDMDIGSDAAEHDEKGNLLNKSDETNKTDFCEKEILKEAMRNIPKENIEPKEDDLDEDEDLLRAKLLTSLSKSLPLKTLLINQDGMQVEDVHSIEKSKRKLVNNKIDVNNIPEEKRFIINTGDSDSSEGEHEATKNLTKMHMKLSEQVDFQHKLDIFLKSARQEVEKKELPDVVQNPQIIVPKTPEKFVPKAVNHLPKSEQIEYKNLVKRMSELEKLKQSRQISMNTLTNKLKPRKVTIDDATKNALLSNLDEQISLSRKKIAEESAKVLQLKEEGTKLSHKYKIVATELRNLSTAISLNKKNQNASQSRLARIRAQHQILLKRSNLTVRNTQSMRSVNTTHKTVIPTNTQKENEPHIGESVDPLKTVKVSVVNDYEPETEMKKHTLSVKIDVASNKQTVTMPKKLNPDKDFARHRIETEKDDYESPLQALSSEGYNYNYERLPISFNPRHRHQRVDKPVLASIAGDKSDVGSTSPREDSHQF